MKDLHCHLLYGIDDGSKTIEETLKLLKEAEKQGIDEMILTPHYIEHSKYMCNNKDKEKLFKTVEKLVKDEKINIKLYLGNEIFFSKHLLELIKNKEVETLNKSKYVLFEFPMNNIYHNTSEILNELTSHGYVPVLAHPERYRILQSHPDLALEYLRSGVLLQANFTSLFGKYGGKAKKTLKYFLKNKWISFLGSDAHHEIGLNEVKLRKKLLRITKDEDYVEKIMSENFDKIIKNEDLGIMR